MYRVLKAPGYMLLREPITSMGDWRKARIGATKRERGIPRRILAQMVRGCGFQVVREAPCALTLMNLFSRISKVPIWCSRPIVNLDAILSRLPIWPRKYYAATKLQKVRVSSVFYVLRRDA
jgi:hypothetical protein